MSNLSSIGLPSQEASPAPEPWWKTPMVWLVWGGPLVVVIASFVTLSIAIKYGDQPLPPSANVGQGQAGKGAAMTPAVQARNHVVTQGARNADR